MDILAAGLITCAALATMFWGMEAYIIRRFLGYAKIMNAAMHTTFIYAFFATSSAGMIQAELAAILITIAMFTLRWAIGYSYLVRSGWKISWKTEPGRFS